MKKETIGYGMDAVEIDGMLGFNWDIPECREDCSLKTVLLEAPESSFNTDERGLCAASYDAHSLGDAQRIDEFLSMSKMKLEFIELKIKLDEFEQLEKEQEQLKEEIKQKEKRKEDLYNDKLLYSKEFCK